MDIPFCEFNFNISDINLSAGNQAHRRHFSSKHRNSVFLVHSQILSRTFFADSGQKKLFSDAAKQMLLKNIHIV